MDMFLAVILHQYIVDIGDVFIEGDEVLDQL